MTNEIRKLAEKHAEEIVKTLVEIMRDVKTPAEIRVRTACTLIGAAWDEDADNDPT